MSAAATTTLGTFLREERLRKQLDLAAIAKTTRICATILAAIENDDFDAMPGGAYRRLFIRQYALALGADGDAALAQFRTQYVEPLLPLPKPYSRPHSSPVMDILCGVLVVACLGSGYEFMQPREAGLIFQRRAPAKQGSADRVAEAPLASRPAPPRAPETSPQTPTAPVHVAFTATERVWVSVKCDGNVSYAGVLDQPQSKSFDAVGAVTALIGNAGGVVVSLNGKPLGPLGAHGDVQVIELTLNGARRIARRAFAPNDPIPQL